MRFSTSGFLLILTIPGHWLITQIFFKFTLKLSKLFKFKETPLEYATPGRSKKFRIFLTFLINLYQKGEFNLFYDFCWIVPLRKTRGLKEIPWSVFQLPGGANSRGVDSPGVCSSRGVWFPGVCSSREVGLPGVCSSRGVNPREEHSPGELTPQEYPPLGQSNF